MALTDDDLGKISVIVTTAVRESKAEVVAELSEKIDKIDAKIDSAIEQITSEITDYRRSHDDW
jgi:hypothetical protein